MRPETARLGMSDLFPQGVDKSAMSTPTGYGAGGSVVIEDGQYGQGLGSFGWGGAAGTIAWVDRGNNLRASGYVQHFPSNATPFREQATAAIYADLSS